MGDRTEIAWTDATWNPVVGCSRVSPGCDHCYAEVQSVRNMTAGSTGYEGVVEQDAESLRWQWTGRVNVAPDQRFDLPLRWTRPRLIFVNSMSDLFHDAVTTDTIKRVFEVMSRCQQHTFQMLTKRPQRMSREMPEVWRSVGGVLPNVWLGVSVESQQYAFRCRHLLETEAAVHWVSAEPLLGHVDLSAYMLPIDGHSRVDWVVAGGESGTQARPMDPEWARRIRRHCQHADVPFLFKQWGNWMPVDASVVGGSTLPKGYVTTPSGHLMQRVAKHVAGRTLDGRLWDEYPAGAARALLTEP